MKIAKFTLIAVTLSSLICSCVDGLKVGNDFLEKAPGVDVTQDTIFSKAEYARQFLWSSYKYMYFGLPLGYDVYWGKMNMNMFESLSDCWHSHTTFDGVCSLYYNGSYNATVEDNNAQVRFAYNGEMCWEVIRDCWIFIENIDKVPDMDGDEKMRLKAEAKVIIATRYFDMFRHFGGLPIIDHAWEPDEFNQAPRATVEDMYKYMIKLIDDSKDYLPWVLDAEEYNNWDGRLTRAAALALKCKIAHFTASPLFNDDVPYCSSSPQDAVNNLNVWTGGYKPELWDDCLTFCEEFFDEVEHKGYYKLLLPKDGVDYGLERNENKYRTAFRDAYSLLGSGYDNPEMLLSIRSSFTNLRRFRDNACPSGAFTPTQEYIDMFPMSDGTPFDWDDPDDVKRIFTDRDPRLYETVVVNGAYLKGEPAQLWVGGKHMTQNSATESGRYATGYTLYKYVLDDQLNKSRLPVWPYIRLSEVHLIYAEALLKHNRLTEAITQIDKIRSRVGLGGLVECNPNKNFEDPDILFDELLRERACELGLEDVRFFDLIRNKMVDNFIKPLHGIRLKRKDGKNVPLETGEPFPTEYEIEKFELNNPTRFMWNEGYVFDSKWYLTAFPPTEINKGYGLVQNPGW